MSLKQTNKQATFSGNATSRFCLFRNNMWKADFIQGKGSDLFLSASAITIEIESEWRKYGFDPFESREISNTIGKLLYSDKSILSDQIIALRLEKRGRLKFITRISRGWTLGKDWAWNWGTWRGTMTALLRGNCRTRRKIEFFGKVKISAENRISCFSKNPWRLLWSAELEQIQ